MSPTPHKFIPVNFSCVPHNNDYTIFLNDYEYGFPSKFLITQWWTQHESLYVLMIVIAHVQFACSMLGVVSSAVRTVNHPKSSHPLAYLHLYASHKILPFFTHFWMMSVGFIILLLPSQWFSNMTMTFILLHAWFEVYAVLPRFLILRRPELSEYRYELCVKWMGFILLVTAIPFMLITNPIEQGKIVAVPAIPGDLLILIMAPYNAYQYIKKNPNWTRAEKVHEALAAALYVIHVVWFSGQGLFACGVSAIAGINFFLTLQIISTLTYVGVVVTDMIIMKRYGEWKHPFKALIQLVFILTPENSQQQYTSTLPPVYGGESPRENTYML